MNKEEDLIVVRTEVEELTRKIDRLEEQVKLLTDALNRYKGFFGGIMLMMSAIGAFITIISHYIKVKS